MSSRTLKVSSPHMRGDDCAAWERTLNAQMKTWGVDFRVPEDGDYDVVDRSLTASVLYGLGMSVKLMEHGVTPYLRIKVRNKRLSPAEKIRYDERRDWRRRFRERMKPAGRSGTHPILARIITDSWGYHPPNHDGIDLICEPSALIFAPVRARVIDVRASGWWGKGAPSAAVAAKGDGIVQIEALETVGPIRAGMHLGFGHAEHATVKVGQVVSPGEVIARAGLANAWHIHLVVNRGEAGNRGVGTLDPRPIVDFVQG